MKKIIVSLDIENEISLLLDEYSEGNGVDTIKAFAYWLGIRLRTKFNQIDSEDMVMYDRFIKKQ